VAPTQKDQLHFQTHKRSWNEQKFCHGSRNQERLCWRGPAAVYWAWISSSKKFLSLNNFFTKWLATDCMGDFLLKQLIHQLHSEARNSSRNWEQKIHSRAHKSPPLVPILSQIASHPHIRFFFQIHVILSFHLRLDSPSGPFLYVTRLKFGTQFSSPSYRNLLHTISLLAKSKND
jgi:hypothetical protein